MKIRDWLKDLEYQLVQGSLETEVTDVVYDSRKLKDGAVFVCMTGTRVDSHSFAAEAVQKGACVIVTEKEIVLPEHVTVIRVDNSRRALSHLSAARFGYPARKMITIGVTGTKGKTTTTHMIKAILEEAGKTVGMIGTNGAVIAGQTYPTVNTTPESYQLQEYFSKMAEAGCEYMIMEVSSQGIKMHRIDGLFFDYGIFTNISPDHIGPDEHKDFEEYLFYKSKLMQLCKVGLVNRDDVHYAEIVKNASCRLYSYSLEQPSDFAGGPIHFLAEPGFVGLEFSVEGSYEIDLKVSIPGRFNAYNALAAVSVCSFLGLSKASACQALSQLKVDGRMEIVHSSERCTVIVDYAHNAVSMESLLSTLRDYKPKRLVCVFGCGGNRSKDRRYSMGEIGGRIADLCILTADNSRYEKVEEIIDDIKIGMAKTQGSYIEIPDRREAICYSITHAEPGDMIAVVGKGHEDYQEVEGVRHPFLDRAVIEEAVSIAGQR